jgi:hypothetical protein
MQAIKKIFERRLYRTAAIAGVVLLIFVGVIYTTRSYAVANVNGDAISVSSFKINYAAAQSYYETLKDEYTKNNVQTQEVSDKQLRASVLDQLVEAEIIDQGLQKEAGGEANGLVADRIKEFTNDESLAIAAKNLYGFSSNDFTREVLIPQAKTDILRGRLFLKNEDFKTWLTAAKKSANVKIFSNDYTWDGVMVRAK